MRQDSQAPGAKAETAVTVAAGSARIWGMTGAERLQRMFRRSGLKLAPAEALASLGGSSGGVLIARADWVYDEGLIKALAVRNGALLVGPTGAALAAHVELKDAAVVASALAEGVDPGRKVTGLTPLDPADLAYNAALRKREPPVLEPLTEANVRNVERRTFQGSYKGVTDIVTKHLWPTPARIVTRWCALAHITPNQVTSLSLLLVLAAFWLFWTGQYGWGLVCAWIMTFLDTVDGKLARVTLTSSPFGNVFDHGIDLIHPPFWWWAWWVGLGAAGMTLPHAEAILAVVLGGYVLQRLVEGVFKRLYGFHVHAWRPFDSWFRLITARRNPNLLLLTGACLFGRPDVGLAAVALWTALSLLVHLVQLAQVFTTPRSKVTSWLAR